MGLNAGEKLGRYRIDSQIGAGGMGEVFLAEDPTLERKVAIKILDEEFANDADRLERFVREARSASALNHPNILTIFEITREGGINYIVSEFVEGETLKSYLRRRRPSLRDALDIAIQSASALTAAHDAGIVHRDIKPANIMIRKDGIVKVVDFGIAKLVQPLFDSGVHGEAPTVKQGGTRPGMMLGTPRYMSPEQARGKPVDRRSDIFSLGLVFYELFTGERAFDGESAVDVLSSILKDEAKPVASVNPALPKQLERIVSKTLRKDLEHRYQDVRDLLIDLEDVRDELRYKEKTGRGGETIQEAVHLTDADTAGVTGSLTQGIVETRRFTLLHALIGVAVVIGLGGAYWLWDASSHEARIFPEDIRTEEVANWSSAAGELQSSGSFSPDGKLIAFTSTKSGSADIWVTQTGSSEPIAVTKDEFSNQYPVWSPKGDEIAYFSQGRQSTGASTFSTGVWRVSALGGSPRAVGAIMDGSSVLRKWGESGKVYFQSGGELWAIGVDDGSSKKITSLSEKGLKAAWVGIADDEKTVIAAAKTEKESRIVRVDIESGAVEDIASHDGDVDGLAWLPDLSVFFFSAMDGEVRQVYGFAPGSAPQKLTAFDTDGSVLDASKAGVLFSTAKEESNIWRASTSGGDETTVARSLDSELWPDPAPDGSKIVYQSVKALNKGTGLFDGSIMVAPVDGKEGNASKLAGPGFLPTWSPSGDTVAFFRYEENDVELAAVDGNGGNIRKLSSGGIDPISFSISPYNRVQANDYAWTNDGKNILYFSKKSGTPELWKADASGATPAAPVTKLGREDVTLACPVVSPDGASAVFYSHGPTRADEDRQRSLWKSDIETGESVKIFETTELFRLLGFASADSVLIAASDSFTGLPEETVIRSVSIASGEVREIARLKNAYFYNVRLSADGETLGFAARRDNKDDLWLIASAGGAERQITRNNDSEIYFSDLSWARDGKSIYFGKQTRFSLLSLITNLNGTGE